MTINAEVTPRPYEPIEKTLRRFKKACIKANVFRDVLDRSTFRTKREKRITKSQRHQLKMKLKRKRR